MTTGGLLLGVDGGNTKSIALVAAVDGSIVGAGRVAGSSDIHAVPIDDAIRRLQEAAAIALEAANGAPRGGSQAPETPVLAAAFSLAGADWPEDISDLEERLSVRWRGALVVNDAIGALRAAIPEGPGVVVVCGTGATTGARGPEGTWHSSFWQLTQGAHELGVQGIKAIVRAELGIGPATVLTRAIAEALGEPDVEAVLHRVTARSRRGLGDQASIAPVVLDAAEHGDDVAVSIARAHGIELGGIAVAAARRVGISGGPFALALGGGVLRHGGRVLPDALVAEVLAAAPEARVMRPTLEPAAGALLLAFDVAGIPVDEAVEARLRATMPGAELFDTRAARPE